MRGILCIGCLLTMSVVVTAVPAYSSTLVSTQNANSIRVQTIDPTTGQVLKNVGVPSGAVHPWDIASDLSAADNKIWAVTEDPFGTSGFELIGIDAHHAVIVSRISLNPQRELLTLAIDPTDGSFYGTTTTELFRIDRQPAPLAGRSYQSNGQ